MVVCCFFARATIVVACSGRDLPAVFLVIHILDYCQTCTMAYELDAHTPSMGLMVKRGQQVNFVEGTGKVYDELPASAASPYPRSKAAIIATSMSMPATANRAPLITSGRPDQDVVIDTSGVAYSVRLHLGKHLHMNQRVEKLERAVAGEEIEEGRCSTVLALYFEGCCVFLLLRAKRRALSIELLYTRALIVG